MNAITLRNIPPELREAIRQRAHTEGLSLNKTVLRMLEGYTGIRHHPGPLLHHELDSLAGTWSDEEAALFEAALEDQRRTDPELWK